MTSNTHAPGPHMEGARRETNATSPQDTRQDAQRVQRHTPNGPVPAASNPWPVRGRVTLRLGRLRENDHAVSRAIQSLEFAPAGAHVVLDVGRGQTVPAIAVDYLRRWCKQLGSVTVEGDDPETVGHWHRAIFPRDE